MKYTIIAIPLVIISLLWMAMWSCRSDSAGLTIADAAGYVYPYKVWRDPRPLYCDFFVYPSITAGADLVMPGNFNWVDDGRND